MSKPSKQTQSAARRARVEQLQREQRAKERRRTYLVVGGAAVVVIVVIAVVVVALTRGSSSGGTTASPGLNVSDQIIPSTPTGATTTQKTPKQVPNPTDIKGVLAWDTSGYPASGKPTAGTLEHQHVTGPVKYAVLPPVGGPHNAIWMNAGVYTKPIPNERAVHNLEHGAVWITYNPNIPQSQVDQLVKFVSGQSLIPEDEQTSPGQANRYVDLSPWAQSDLPSPIVHQLLGIPAPGQQPDRPPPPAVRRHLPAQPDLHPRVRRAGRRGADRDRRSPCWVRQCEPEPRWLARLTATDPASSSHWPGVGSAG